ncbi:hypothetical protein PIB30_059223 [Stylosanthes scabra]|uniref:Uncharacterized protein n=1 Tax=Stylosanthes scabra TaxID=79078 RepID=A0ABU6RK55_9FABA|nr:hypothetical protein [Stylosanthes scabra]
MGSGVIYYEYEKRGKFEDHDMRADAELGTFKIRRYHFDNESFVHPLHSVRFDPDRPYEIPIEALMADKIASASKSEESSAERRCSSRCPSPHYSPRTMPVAQRERSTSSVKGTRSFRRGTASGSVRKLRSWELIPPSEGWMCDADDEKEIGGMDASEKGESSEEDPEMEEEYPEEAGNPEDRVPATPSMPMDIDAEEDFQRYVEELGRAPELSPLRSSQASVPDEPVEAADRQLASRDGPSYDVSGVWPPRSLSPSVVHGVENWGVTRFPGNGAKNMTELRMGLLLKAFSFTLSPFRKGVTGSDELSPRRNTPPKRHRYRGGVCNQQLVLKELVEPTVTRPTPRIPMITVVNPCRRDPTLASRGVRIAVTDLTQFLPIQSYGGLAAKVICTFHPTAETLWDSTRYLKS